MPLPSDTARALADALESSWAGKARANQRPPPGDWSVWLLLAGRGFGKTRVLSEMANNWAVSGRCKRLAVVAATAADARDVMVEGESGILETAPSWCRPIYETSRRRVTWPNGAVAYTYSAEEPDRLRGPQHDGALCDELASWSRPETWDQLQFGLRLGHPRVVVATTPRPTKLVKNLLLREGQDVVITRGSTFENADNLAPAFFSQIVNRYEGTRLGRQELLAEVLMDIPGALWSLETIEKSRRDRAPDLQRVVIAIDPAVSSNEGSNETGIVAVGKDGNGHGYVLADYSGKYTPIEWASKAVSAYREYSADRIVAEVNNGGDLVEATLRMVDANMPFTAVHASRGKYTRAEPIAALFEQLKVHLVGNFPQLEDQMTSFVPDIDRGRMGSPDRVDALVWGLSELLVTPERWSGLIQYYREQTEAMRAGRDAEQPTAP